MMEAQLCFSKDMRSISEDESPIPVSLCAGQKMKMIKIKKKLNTGYPKLETEAAVDSFV